MYSAANRKCRETSSTHFNACRTILRRPAALESVRHCMITRVLACIDWGGRCFEHFLWIVTWLARRTQQFLNCKCVTSVVSKMLRSEGICRCNLSVKHKSHSLPYIRLYMFFLCLLWRTHPFLSFSKNFRHSCLMLSEHINGNGDSSDWERECHCLIQAEIAKSVRRYRKNN